ncbi:MAG TPA: NAD(P)/FAD-dependent oxidoreductase [Polyangiaceae bacterium]|nr:NAD(P)/FAD-dependent oxidoreductase [Polyangiaceae bacterium]
MTDPDIVVIGSGPNGLTAACTLAKRGHRVLVLETNPRRPGGALGSEEWTLPGFVHDVGAGFFPFGRSSPAFRALDLEAAGVVWQNAQLESCHPALDGTHAAIARDPELAARHFGSERDGDAWRKLARFHRGIEPRLLEALMDPFPALGPALKLGAGNLLRIASMFAKSGKRLATGLFRSEAARRVLPSLALHVDVGPDDWFGAGLGYMLGLTASTGGYAVPRGGAQAITNALVTLLERQGGRLRLGARVLRILVRGRRAVGVMLESGEEIRATRAVLADTSAPALWLDLLQGQDLPGFALRKMRKFPLGFGTFKLDYALDGPVPWSVPEARVSAVVHAGESLDDLSRFVREVRSGQLPERPYLVMGQQSLIDRTRAPQNGHTLYVYSRVPSDLPGGWDAARERFADTITSRIDGLAPGFKSLVLARKAHAPNDLESMNQNLKGGDLGGGSNAWNRQLLFRPVFPYFRYRMPIARLYLCSSYAHPGAGVHGMCGYNAARIALRDIE